MCVLHVALRGMHPRAKMRRISCRMLKMSASFVLESFIPQRGPSRLTYSAARADVVLLIRRTVRPRGDASGFDSPEALPVERRVWARRGLGG
jgi:hypothetical protein